CNLYHHSRASSRESAKSDTDEDRCDSRQQQKSSIRFRDGNRPYVERRWTKAAAAHLKTLPIDKPGRSFAGSENDFGTVESKRHNRTGKYFAAAVDIHSRYTGFHQDELVQCRPG